jgi:capsular polysaccharide biosynthesis protein
MELKEYLQIIRKNIDLFLAVTALVVAGTLSYFYFQPVSYRTSLLINVTRQGKDTSADYRYDDFYRLQADERFADTIVEWLKSPRIVANIFSSAGTSMQNFTLDMLKKSLAAERRSSQIVAVSFSSVSRETAKNLSAGVVKEISADTEKLNRDQKEDNWFQIMADDPITIQDVPRWKIIFLAAFSAGIFLAFWTVMIKHYMG